MSNYDDLMARAGVSKDHDIDAWKAQRNLGVTATNIRDIVKSGSERKRILGIKRGEPDTFTGNQYTEWGNAREDVLAPVLKGAGIEPESRVFFSAENPRYLASPDGVGEDLFGEIVLAEVKTSKHDLKPGSERFEASGYYDQMQWQMLVCGAARTLFVWEQHDDEWPTPTPFPHQVEWIDRDDDRIEYLRAVADEFLAELDGSKPFTDRELQRIRVQADKFALHRLRAAEAEQELRRLIGDRRISEALDSKRFDQVKVSFGGNGLKPALRVDEERAKQERPELWDALQAAQAAWQNTLADRYTVRELKPSKGRLTVKEVLEEKAA